MLACDASNLGMGAVLMQQDAEGRRQPVYFTSRKFNDTERGWTISERELASCVFGISQFRHYLLGREFLLLCDHESLKYLRTNKYNNARLMRWSLALQGLDFDIEYCPGELHAGPDGLSRLPRYQLEYNRLCKRVARDVEKELREAGHRNVKPSLVNSIASLTEN